MVLVNKVIARSNEGQIFELLNNEGYLGIEIGNNRLTHFFKWEYPGYIMFEILKIPLFKDAKLNRILVYSGNWTDCVRRMHIGGLL
ncbi:hypothetical protein NQ318_015923 [Aromia moschata]|uniref:Uncharacterized protein n=1 Tax=Aromia moschata TaxID=1265417 RepID=A0AAV8XSD6_9CUCU|nr:hypothetical protein NQ318_015923 [Aromia moschata]